MRTPRQYALFQRVCSELPCGVSATQACVSAQATRPLKYPPQRHLFWSCLDEACNRSLANLRLSFHFKPDFFAFRSYFLVVFISVVQKHFLDLIPYHFSSFTVFGGLRPPLMLLWECLLRLRKKASLFCPCLVYEISLALSKTIGYKTRCPACPTHTSVSGEVVVLGRCHRVLRCIPVGGCRAISEGVLRIFLFFLFFSFLLFLRRDVLKGV